MPTMRPKRVLVDALERKIREVLVPRDEANPKPVQVDLRGGLISLEDVKFAAPKKLTLPFQIRDSLVRRVRIRFSIKRILTQQLDVHLEGLALVLEPRHGDPTVEEARDIFRGAKQRAILGAEMWSVPLNSLLERELDGQPEAGRFSHMKAVLKRAIGQAVRQARLHVQSVHLRYESYVDGGQLAACGLTVQLITDLEDRGGTSAEGHDGADDGGGAAEEEEERRRRGGRGGARVSRTLKVLGLGVYCEEVVDDERPWDAHDCLARVEGFGDAEPGDAGTDAADAAGAASQPPPSSGKESGGLARPRLSTITSRDLPWAPAAAPAATAPAGGESGGGGGIESSTSETFASERPSQARFARLPYVLRPFSFAVAVNAQAEEVPDLSQPHTSIWIEPLGGSGSGGSGGSGGGGEAAAEAAAAAAERRCAADGRRRFGASAEDDGSDRDESQALRGAAARAAQRAAEARDWRGAAAVVAVRAAVRGGEKERTDDHHRVLEVHVVGAVARAADALALSAAPPHGTVQPDASADTAVRAWPAPHPASPASPATGTTIRQCRSSRWRSARNCSKWKTCWSSTRSCCSAGLLRGR